MKVGPNPGDNLPTRTPQHSISTIRSGDTLRVFVEARRGSNFAVRSGSLRFLARLSGEVRVGAWFRVEVVRTGQTIVLKTVDRPSIPLDPSPPSRSYGLPPGEAEAVIRAFVRSGLPLHSDRLALAWRRVQSSTRLSLAERSRLAAVLEEKGLLDSTSVWDRAVESLAGRDGTEDSPRDRRDPADERTPDQPEDPIGGGEDVEAPVTSAEIRAALAAGEVSDDPLQLLNHRSGRDGHWMIVPLRFEGVEGFSASLKIRLPGERETNESVSGRFREAVIDVRCGDERWTFGVLPAGSSVRVVALASPDQADGAGNRDDFAWSALRERLSKLGIDFASLIMSKDSNDGFSTADEPGILRSVDSRA